MVGGILNQPYVGGLSKYWLVMMVMFLPVLAKNPFH